MNTKLVVKRIVSQMFEENSYLLHKEGDTDCAVVDPGLEPELIIEQIDALGLTPKALLITHGHADHIAGNGAIKARWPEAEIIVGQADAPKLLDARLNLSGPFGFGLTSPPADRVVNDGDILSIAGLNVEVRAVPGHSIGHVVYVIGEVQPPVAFVGDVIMAGSIGRTDFPDGDFEQLTSGIRDKLFSLADDTILHSGHGPATTVGTERRDNPFVGKRARFA